MPDIQGLTEAIVENFAPGVNWHVVDLCSQKEGLFECLVQTF